MCPFTEKKITPFQQNPHPSDNEQQQIMVSYGKFNWQYTILFVLCQRREALMELKKLKNNVVMKCTTRSVL